MKISIIVVVAAAILCLIAFPTTTVGKNLRFLPKPTQGWPHPSEASTNKMFMSTSHKFNYGDSKVWRCTYSNGSAPAISISPSTPITPSPSTPSTPSPSTPSPSPPTPKTSPPPPTLTPPPPTPKKAPSLIPPTSKKGPSPPPPTPSPPPPTPTKASSPPSPTPSLPPQTPKKSPSPSPPTPSLPPPTPKITPFPRPPTPALPPPTPKKSPSPSPPSDDESLSPSQPSNPPPEHHHHSHHQHHEYPLEHVGRCVRNMGHVGFCRGQMEISFYTRLFKVSKYCCNLIVNMKNECDDVIWGYFYDPHFVPLVRCTCHVTF
ncbi:hypothetical protein Bca4012_026122 [Brassica carinata]|uniref:Prolamin-like domain-containing protein n=1 Tax=Brassica carinata TaxID=52824 RepID=A0A8X8AVE5_BRACI|nr:hypothetical protein Bca52824_023224 [Brassica carinata]